MPEFKIQHITKYTYDGLVRDSANQIILYPIQDEFQNVTKHELKITGDAPVDTYIDYYGNKVGSFTHRDPHSQLIISSQLWVDTKARALPTNDIFPQQQWKDYETLKYVVPYIDFLKQEYFDGQAELKAIVDAVLDTADTPYQAILKFSKYIFDNFSYIKGVTTVESTLDDVWKLRAGVCQDFAHILMVMLRLINIPARYVSGYICPNQNGMRGEGATHAWAEAYLPDYGWLGVDPTNNVVVNDTHVRLAVGRNFSDCSPVKGTYKGQYSHRLEVAVSVGYHKDGQMTGTEIVEVFDEPIIKPITPDLSKNSYQRYMEMIQQQQQQQQ
ncbi:transglutaminase family protein [Mucilaginibacter myungsuensis]|uniref:Transglutaminase family protein n=1 Tax=Mucilaginibacter myungsuensis TaxID=649104 RepID=A0A929KZ19_9SPHI|nr:transglutaminase family protein [Mucilaginibacter myungsuensis]MBE9663807.1 transglutaminase family protein [Mucilaginibacter myungsuensis]MDN3598478.1 transglutaminase family protein [Mucilaginibacter myungsuensis]